MNKWLIGIDDTDNFESRGTGHLARQLARWLESTISGVKIGSITRHQLLVDPRIPYTSHNSSACILAEFDANCRADVISIASHFLQNESAPGSDAGLCVAKFSAISPAVIAFGQSAKTQVLMMDDACQLANRENIFLTGLTGTEGGVIGALAAVGLHASGNDGRFLWRQGLREISGCFTISQLRESAGIDRVETESGIIPADDALIDTGHWVRPILRDHLAVLLVEESDNAPSRWRVVARDRIKELSS
jgi:hypothetical protein